MRCRPDVFITDDIFGRCLVQCSFWCSASNAKERSRNDRCFSFVQIWTMHPTVIQIEQSLLLQRVNKKNFSFKQASGRRSQADQGFSRLSTILPLKETTGWLTGYPEHPIFGLTRLKFLTLELLSVHLGIYSFPNTPKTLLNQHASVLKDNKKPCPCELWSDYL